jgi:RHS repeat-associated protein
VGSAPAPANVMYIHDDHLGTPQKMTDAAKAITWDRVQDPFGNTHSLSGASQNPLRFPGQYADEESALSYNYFRDYDPTLGRYVQSDPVGLGGGLNTFAYVGANPINFVDPNGLVQGPTVVITPCRLVLLTPLPVCPPRTKCEYECLDGTPYSYEVDGDGAECWMIVVKPHGFNPK